MRWQPTPTPNPQASSSATPPSPSTTATTTSNSGLPKPANDRSSSVPQASHDAPNPFRALLQAALLIHRHRNRQRSLQSVAPHNPRQAQAHILHVSKPANLPTHRQNAPIIVQNGFENVAHRQPHRVIGRAFALDYLVSGFLHILDDGI